MGFTLKACPESSTHGPTTTRLPSPGQLTCEPPTGVPALVFSVSVLVTLLGSACGAWCLVSYSAIDLQVTICLSSSRLSVDTRPCPVWLWVMKASCTFLKSSSKLWPLHSCTWAAKPGMGHSMTSSSGQHGGQTQARLMLDLRDPVRSNCESCVNVPQGTSSFLFS